MLKTKRSAFVLIAVLGVLFLIYALNDGEVAPVIHTIVIATKTKIHGAAADNVDDVTANIQKYLDMLGFGDAKAAIGRTSGKPLPLVIATAALSRYYDQTFRFVKSFGRAFPNASIVLFDLDLWHNEASKLDAHCNTTGRCALRSFDLSPFPSHVRDLTTRAYKPIMLQTLLSEFCAVVWVDVNSPLSVPTNRFVSLVNELTCPRTNEKPVETVTAPASVKRRKRDDTQLREARSKRLPVSNGDSGLLGWSISLPTSALTQTGTFERLGEPAEHFYFSRMLSTSHLLLYRRDCCSAASGRNEGQDSLRRSMFEWIRCVLDSRCLTPTGSQSGLCNLARVPSFKFSGCHLFEMSALNVVLGAQYHYDVAPCSLDARISIFDAFNSSMAVRPQSVASSASAASVNNLSPSSSHSALLAIDSVARTSLIDTQSVNDETFDSVNSGYSTLNRHNEASKRTARRAGFSLPFFEGYSNQIRWFSESQVERQDETESEVYSAF